MGGSFHVIGHFPKPQRKKKRERKQNNGRCEIVLLLLGCTGGRGSCRLRVITLHPRKSFLHRGQLILVDKTPKTKVDGRQWAAPGEQRHAAEDKKSTRLARVEFVNLREAGGHRKKQCHRRPRQTPFFLQNRRPLPLSSTALSLAALARLLAAHAPCNGEQGETARRRER